MADFVNDQDQLAPFLPDALFTPQPQGNLNFRCVVEAANAVRATQQGVPLSGNICNYPADAHNVCVLRKHCKAHQIYVFWHEFCRSHVLGDAEAFRDHKANCHTRLTAKRNAAAKEQAWINLYRLVNGPDLPLPSTPYTNHWAWIG